MIDEKLRVLADNNLCEDMRSTSSEDWRILDDIIVIIERITRDTRISINVNPLFIF